MMDIEARLVFFASIHIRFEALVDGGSVGSVFCLVFRPGDADAGDSTDCVVVLLQAR